MKKLMTFLLAFIMVFSLSACGGKNDKFEGTWKVDYIEYEGSKFSVNDLENSNDEDLNGLYKGLNDFYLILKNGGEAYLYVDGYGDSGNWLKSDDGNSIIIGTQKCEIVDNMICLDFDGNKVFLKKASNSQEIPKENIENEGISDNDYSSVDETDSSESEIDSTSDDAEWKKFLKDYEAWVDDYIAIVKKYKDNPTDMSILTEYTVMVSEMADWSDRADEIELELEDTDAALEYAAELSRIALKLAEAAY